MQSPVSYTKIPDRDQNMLKNPNIFQYMKLAGYSTAYIEGQKDVVRPINFMCV